MEKIDKNEKKMKLFTCYNIPYLLFYILQWLLNLLMSPHPPPPAALAKPTKMMLNTV